MEASGSAVRRSSPLGPALMIVGAALVLIGCLMPWFRFSADFSSFGGAALPTRTANGLDTSDGTIFLVFAIAIAALAVVALVAKTRGPKVIGSVISALGALFVGGVGIYDAATPKAQAIEEVSKRAGGGVGAEVVKRFMEQLFDKGLIKINVQAGLWIVLVGAAIALVGSLLSAVAGSKAQAPGDRAPMSQPAGPGWAPATATPAGAPLPPQPAYEPPPPAEPAQEPPTAEPGPEPRSSPEPAEPRPEPAPEGDPTGP